jgi:[ribosomal protein S5]-alanine N-acetyltransferase
VERAPERFETRRMVLRRPIAADARSIFERYAGDPEVTRYLAWPRHLTLDDTRLFLTFSDAEWRRTGSGPYLAVSALDGSLLGSTGLAVESDDRVSTGYAFARDEWGKGYATEALVAMVEVASMIGLRQLYAICHVDHRASWHVMEKCGFKRDGILTRHMVFPNLGPDAVDVMSYSRVIT